MEIWAEHTLLLLKFCLPGPTTRPQGIAYDSTMGSKTVSIHNGPSQPSSERLSPDCVLEFNLSWVLNEVNLARGGTGGRDFQGGRGASWVGRAQEVGLRKEASLAECRGHLTLVKGTQVLRHRSSVLVGMRSFIRAFTPEALLCKAQSWLLGIGWWTKQEPSLPPGLEEETEAHQVVLPGFQRGQ